MSGQRRQRPYRRLDHAPRGPRSSAGWARTGRPARWRATWGAPRPASPTRSGATARRHARPGQGVERAESVPEGACARLQRLAPRLQRLQQAPLPLRGARSAASTPRPAPSGLADGDAVRRQARRRAGTEGEFESVGRRHQGRPGPQACRPPRSAGRPLVRVQGRPLHHLPLDRAGLRRHVQHGALRRKVGYKAEEEGRRPRPPPHGPERSFAGLLGAPGGRARGRLRDGHGDRARRRPAVRPHAPPALLPRPAAACFCPRGRRARWPPRSTCWRRPSGTRAAFQRMLGLASSPTTARSSPTGSPAGEVSACRARAPAAESTTATCASPSRRAAASATTSSCRKLLPKRPRHIVRRPGGRPTWRPAMSQLNSEPRPSMAFMPPAAGAPGRLRRRRRRAHGRARRRGGALRRAAARRRGRSTAPGWRGGRSRSPSPSRQPSSPSPGPSR